VGGWQANPLGAISLRMHELLMDPIHIPNGDHVLSLEGPLHVILEKTINHLSKIKFDGDGENISFLHANQYYLFCYFLKTCHEDTVCNLFPLTLKGQIVAWYDAIRANFTHNWKQFKETFLVD
jgi:hypothetical protein